MRKKLNEPLDIERYTLKLDRRLCAPAGVRYCTRCVSRITFEEAWYCPVCGASSLIRGRASDMIYRKIKVNENSKAIVCPHCGNEELTPGDYCVICGNEIVNRCADTPVSEKEKPVIKGCKITLPGNARYCYKCGNESTFYQHGWLKDWRSENTRKAIENINVTLDFDDLKKGRNLG